MTMSSLFSNLNIKINKLKLPVMLYSKLIYNALNRGLVKITTFTKNKLHDTMNACNGRFATINRYYAFYISNTYIYEKNQ